MASDHLLILSASGCTEHRRCLRNHHLVVDDRCNLYLVVYGTVLGHLVVVYRRTVDLGNLNIADLRRYRTGRADKVERFLELLSIFLATAYVGASASGSTAATRTSASSFFLRRGRSNRRNLIAW